MKIILAAAFAASLAAVPAFAAEEYQSGPALVLNGQAPSLDIGSAQPPTLDGSAIRWTSRSRLVSGNGAEASVETINSESVPLGTYHASIGLLASR